MRRLLILLALLSIPSLASAKEGWRDWCWNGGKRVTTSGLNSTTTVQATTASCTVTIYVHGGGLATIYSDNNGTPLANPFTGTTPNGQFIWYAANGRYDQTINVTINGQANTVTMSDILLCDPFETGSTCNNGGSSTAHNLLSTTHLDTVPESPPVRGDLITAQNLTSPSSVTPAWAALPLGTSGYVLTSNGTDAIWAPAPGGGTGCTLPGTDTGILTEHPVGTCYNSIDATWDDGASKQNLLIGDGTSVLNSPNSLTFMIGPGNFSTSTTKSTSLVFTYGEGNVVTPSAVDNTSEYYTFGTVNSINNTEGSNFVFGDSNAIQRAQSEIYLLGQANLFQGTGGGGLQATAGDCFVTGGNNTISVAETVAGFGPCSVHGYINSFTITGTHSYDSFFIGGESNTVTGSTSGMSGVHVIGSLNVIKDTLAQTNQVEVVGEVNEVDGSISTVQILGYKNIAHNVSAQAIPTVNQTIVGSANTVTNTGASGNPAYEEVFGHLNTQTSCSNCISVGANISQSTSDQLAIGLSSAAEIIMVAGHVALNAHLDQTATGKFAGSCAMSAATTCTFSIAAAFTGTPLCVTSIDAASAVPATANVAKCSVSGTTVTITAGILNSLTWDAILIGNPN